MTAITRKPAAVEICSDERSQATVHSHARLILRPTEDGWSLIGPDGHLVFRGFGLKGRRECLEFARGCGVHAVFS
jgi:hypothetical protein